MIHAPNTFHTLNKIKSDNLNDIAIIENENDLNSLGIINRNIFAT